MVVTLSGWFGAALMCAAPFIIDTDEGKILSILGLLMLTIQAWPQRLWNLVGLNLVGIIGYCYALFS